MMDLTTRCVEEMRKMDKEFGDDPHYGVIIHNPHEVEMTDVPVDGAVRVIELVNQAAGFPAVPVGPPILGIGL